MKLKLKLLNKNKKDAKENKNCVFFTKKLNIIIAAKKYTSFNSCISRKAITTYIKCIRFEREEDLLSLHFFNA